MLISILTTHIIINANGLFCYVPVNNLLQGMGEKIVIPKSYKPKISYQTLIEQLGYVRELTLRDSSSQGSSGTVNDPNQPTSSQTYSVAFKAEGSSINKPSNTNRSESRSNENNEAWNSHMKKYRKEAFDRIKLSVKEKMEAASPYNFFLTTIKDSPETHKDHSSISFPGKHILKLHFDT